MAEKEADNPAELPSEEEANQMLAKLRQMAQEWRTRLDDPVIQSMVKSGQMQISPLVEKLLRAFPPKSKK